ncbi:MAG: transglutaminase domain-containing protein [Deltaproteobacteria bacterium]|nr:transglutaminase domain-containing protein [Deltaproteobacteria bacterium]
MNKLFCLLKPCICVFALAIVSVLLVAAKTSISTPIKEITPFDLTYGVYLNSSKVGWMRSAMMLNKDKSIKIILELHAAVGGMGQVSTIDISENRKYAGPKMMLQELSFIQKAATGQVIVTGKRSNKELLLTVQAGDAQTQQHHEVLETVYDALAANKLARTGKVGDSVISQHFDPSLQRNITIQQHVKAIENRMFAGVVTRTLRIDATYNDLGINETSWFDETGKILETKVGGFFIARLEPPDVAKKLDYQQDLLVAAVVKTPRAINNPETLEHLTVAFSGFGKMDPPSSPRQKVDRQGDLVVLSLTRDPVLPKISLADMKIPNEIKSEIVATPFIQSQASAIRKAAIAAKGNANLLPEVVEGLTHYVYNHIKAEYVPAYSNALEALNSGRGDCTEYSVLFVGLARALGIPARVAVGIAYWPPGDGFGWHAWAEVFADGRWYTVDPTWNQPIADATHVKLAGGGPAEQARIVMLLGNLKVVALAD